MRIQTVTLITLWLQTATALQVLQPYRVVASSGQVTLQCSYVTSDQPEELRLTLLRGMYGYQEVCASTFNISQSEFEAQGSARCLGMVQQSSVDLTVSGLKGADTDLYRCLVEVLYPPPYEQKYGSGTLLYIPEEPDCPVVSEKLTAEPEDSSNTPYIIPITLFAFTIIIIIIIIAVTYNIGVQKSRREFIVLPTVASKMKECGFGYENFT